MESYPAGWYPDYSHAGQQRYWDGESWTRYVHSDEEPPGSRWRRRKGQTFKPSAQLVSATYRMLFDDSSMIWLLFLGSLGAALVGGMILLPAVYWGHVTPTWDDGGVLGVLVAGASYGAANFVLELICGAVVGAAMLRAEGRPATVRQAVGIAWGRRRELLAWALVSTVIGAVIRVLERLGAGGIVAALTLNIGWALATVFATPVIMVEGTMPAATVRRSAGLLRRQFTVTLVSGIALELPWIVLGFFSMTFAVVGAVILVVSASALMMTVGFAVFVAGAIGFCYVLAVSSALSAYLQACLYRYAVGLTIPGVDPHWLPPRRPS